MSTEVSSNTLIARTRGKAERYTLSTPDDQGIKVCKDHALSASCARDLMLGREEDKRREE